MSKNKPNLCWQQLGLFALVLLAAAFAGAAEEAHHEGLTAHEKSTIMYQTINVSLLVLGLIYFLREPVRTFFSDKRKAFQAAAEKAAQALQIAEDNRIAIEVRLNQLKGTADESLSRARAEAADMRNQMLKDAAEISARLQKEAKATAALETNKAREALRLQLITQAASLTEEFLEKKVTAADQSRLQGEFIDNIQTVQS